MNLVSFINYLIDPEELTDLLIDLEPDGEFEDLLVYLKEGLDPHSEVSVFGAEETGGDEVFKKKGNTYVVLFPLEMVQEIVEDVMAVHSRISNDEVAERLIRYRIKGDDEPV